MGEKADLDDHLTAGQIQRLAKQILIRTSREWSGPHARRLTGWALADSDVHIAPDVFRGVVSAVFRIGRLHPPVSALFRRIPLGVAEVAAQLCVDGLGWIEGEYGKSLIARLHQRLASNSYETLKRIDWVELVNRTAEHFDIDVLIDVSLLDKVRLADAAWDIRAQRLDRLAAAAAEEHGVTIAQVADALRAGFVMSSPQAIHDRCRQSEDVDCGEDFDWFLDLAPAARRGDLEYKLRTLPAAARTQLLRRAAWLIREPLAATMWSKPIKSWSGLRELKVIASGSHFRVLYTQTQERIVVLDLGLRRDLDLLIKGLKSG